MLILRSNRRVWRNRLSLRVRRVMIGVIKIVRGNEQGFE
jgi:hypothetical protein